MPSQDTARDDDPSPDPHDGRLMARLAAPAAEEPTRLAVVADPHVSTRETGTSKLYGRTRAHFETAIEDIRERNPDAVVSVGDLTKDGEPWNYEAVDEVLAALTVPFYSVPGNHDVPKGSDPHDAPPVAAFADRYAPGEQGYPFHVRVGGVDLLGLNSAGGDGRLTDTHDGAVDADQLAWLADALDRAAVPLVVVHHNLPATYDQYRAYRETVDDSLAMPPTTRNPEPLVETLAEGGAPLVVSGHYHIPATAVTEGVRELMVPATCSFPQAYLLFDIGPAGTTVRMIPVADGDGLREAHHSRASDSEAARALTSMAAVRLARFPLVDE